MLKHQYLKRVYGHSLALLVDLYHLTMAYGFWKKGMAEKEAVFNLFFRRPPFQGAFAVAAGLEVAVEYMQNFRFKEDDLNYLSHLKQSGGQKLFEPAFLDYLSTLSIQCDVDAMPEGTPLFPYEPLIRVKGPLIQAQLMEAPLLNILNFQTLIATKAARISWAARPNPVIEFGLRRAQGIDGALSGVRAAYIGGCEATSNVLAAQLFEIPVKGTHAHSWIMAFDSEEDAFEACAEVFVKDCMFLVDTYNTQAGIKKAIAVVKKMKARGVEMLGLRLDSGDLVSLSLEARKRLNDGGFSNAKIMASNELDEYIITDLKHRGAQIDVWGVGSNLITAKDQPSLDGVYKLCAIRDKGQQWQYKMKLSDQSVKMTNPGILQVKRFFDGENYVADMLFDSESILDKECDIVDLFEPHLLKKQAAEWKGEDLLIPIVRAGRIVYNFPSLMQIRQRGLEELATFDAGIRRLLHPQRYFYGLESSLYKKKMSLIDHLKERA